MTLHAESERGGNRTVSVATPDALVAYAFPRPRAGRPLGHPGRAVGLTRCSGALGTSRAGDPIAARAAG